MSDDEDRKLLIRGFARFVIKQGHGAQCPALKSRGEPMTWQQRGRELYGAEIFATVMREELERMKAAAQATPT